MAAQYLPQKPAAIPLIAALAVNSHFLYGNIGVMTAGIIPYALKHSTPFEMVRATNWFIERGKNTFLATAIVSTALFGCTAFYAPEPRIQHLTTVATVAMFGVVPWSAIVMLPINNALMEMESGGVRAFEGKEEKAVEKVKAWRARHVVRMVLATVGWLAGVAALEML